MVYNVPGDIGMEIVVQSKPINLVKDKPLGPRPSFDESNIVAHDFKNQFHADPSTCPQVPGRVLGRRGIGDAQDLSAAGRVGPVVKEPLQVGRK